MKLLAIFAPLGLLLAVEPTLAAACRVARLYMPGPLPQSQSGETLAIAAVMPGTQDASTVAVRIEETIYGRVGRQRIRMYQPAETPPDVDENGDQVVVMSCGLPPHRARAGDRILIVLQGENAEQDIVYWEWLHAATMTNPPLRDYLAARRLNERRRVGERWRRERNPEPGAQ